MTRRPRAVYGATQGEACAVDRHSVPMMSRVILNILLLFVADYRSLVVAGKSQEGNLNTHQKGSDEEYVSSS